MYVLSSGRSLAEVQQTHSQPLARLLALVRWCNRIPHDYPRAEKSTAAGFYGTFDDFSWGGDEETVVKKGSPWPQEIARVLSSMLPLAGIPARLVFLYRAAPPAMHTVVEAWVGGGWAVCDASANRCYSWPHHGYASANDLQQQPRLVDQLPEHGRNPYVDSRFYETVAISASAPQHWPPDAYALHKALQSEARMLQEACRVFSNS